MGKSIKGVLVLMSYLLAATGAAAAQSTFATLTGAVSDPTGAFVPGVEVRATHVATNLEAATVTNEAGLYTLAQLREGQYVVKAALPGFKEFVVRDVLLSARDVRRLDIRLEMGEMQDSIEVLSGATLIETETPRINDLRSSKELKTLPLNSVGLWAYMIVSPMYGRLFGTTPTFAGSREHQWQMSVDGTSVSDGKGGDTAGNALAYNESFEELQVNIVNNSAEFPTLGQITVVTKSGTNDFHGSVYDLYSSPIFRTRDPFTNQVGTGIQRNAGFSLSGPLRLPGLYDGRNRTFWYVGGDCLCISQVTVSLRPTVPLASWRQGNFSAQRLQIRNPFTGEVYKDGVIPQQHINPVSKKIQERFYPVPNVANPGLFRSRNFESDFSLPGNRSNNATVRLDHKLTDADSVYASFRHNGLAVNQIWEGGLPAFGPRDQLRQQKALNVVYHRTFTPNFVNEFRIGHSFNNNVLGGPLNGLEVLRSLGIEGLAPNLPNIPGVFRMGFAGLGLTGLSQINYQNPGFASKVRNYQDQISWFHGRHGIKAGVQAVRLRFENLEVPSDLFGSVSFANTYTRVPGVSASGHPYADFLFGVPTSVSRSFPPFVRDDVSWAHEFFFQDDWKVTPRLTVNLGLRYELRTPWEEQSGRSSTFDVASGKIVIADKGRDLVSSLVPKNYVDVALAGSLGFDRRRLIKTDRNNWAPRVGFAFRPFNDNTTVIRAGYGIFYNNVLPEVTAGGVPFNIAEPVFTNTSPVPAIVLPRAFPAQGSGGPQTISIPIAIKPNLAVPYSQQWNLTLEQQRWGMGFRLSYVGTNSRQMLYSYDYNAPVPDGRLYVDKPRPFPKYPSIGFIDNGASHNYNALNLEVERKVTTGLQFQSSWTWARDIGDALDLTGRIENPFDRSRERAPQLGIPTHRLVNSMIYDLPVGRGRRWMASAPAVLEAIAGGWQVSAVGVLQTGQFLTPTVRIADPTGTAFTSGRNRPLVAIRPDLLTDPNLEEPTTARWFDVGAFGAPPVGRFGNSARGVILGPGVNVWHLGLFKTFRLAVEGRVRFRAGLIATNAFNHPNWNNPNTNLSAVPGRGEINGIGGPTAGSLGDKATQRNMALNLRLEW